MAITKIRIAIKRQLVKELGGQCRECGYNKSLAALEFHHYDDNKNNTIASLMSKNSFNLDLIRNEARKCIILCSNCHRELHSSDENLI